MTTQLKRREHMYIYNTELEPDILTAIDYFGLQRSSPRTCRTTRHYRASPANRRFATGDRQSLSPKLAQQVSRTLLSGTSDIHNLVLTSDRLVSVECGDVRASICAYLNATQMIRASLFRLNRCDIET